MSEVEVNMLDIEFLEQGIDVEELLAGRYGGLRQERLASGLG